MGFEWWPTVDVGIRMQTGEIQPKPDRTMLDALNEEHRTFVERVAGEHRLTFQEKRRLVEIARDMELWGERGLAAWWDDQRSKSTLTGRELKRHMLASLERMVKGIFDRPARYTAGDSSRPVARDSKPVVTRSSDKKVWGMCPVASDKTVCCNLRTIDAVENCVFGCSYCTVQTFYTKEVVFDGDFARKLNEIPIEPGRFYHFGTGQASDSLAWGNRNGTLDALCGWAADHPDVLLELKTKSSNVRYFTDGDPDVPANVVCSWSLNTPAVVEHEEHFTASLDDRLNAARAVADEGVGVAFHFHPMVWYEGWPADYTRLAGMVIDRFAPEEVRFVSFGSVTLIKPVIRKIRELGNPTKINQVELVPDPHGKLTYTDDIKVQLYKKIYSAFAPWKDDVFMYLCMEKRSIWERTFGYAYDTNAEFESDFGRRTMPRRC